MIRKPASDDGAETCDDVEDPRRNTRLDQDLPEKLSVEPEVISLGLHTTVQPDARMKGTRSHRMKNGKFQGVITPTTPIGSRVTIPNIFSPRLLKASPCSARA